MASAPAPKKPLQYDAKSKRKFVKYFVQPKAKRGRPKKKKNRRGRPSKKGSNEPKQAVMGAHNFVDLTTKQKDNLDAKLEGIVNRALKKAKMKRINWDVEPHRAYRQRLADSWINKNDLYVEGESYNRFCIRHDIHRGVLSRYLQLLERHKGEVAKKKRGRRPLLSMSVMRNLCEGMCMHVMHFNNRILTNKI